MAVEHINDVGDEDGDFAPIDFSLLIKPFIQSTRKQRERLERIGDKRGWRWKRLLEECGKVIGKEVGDTGKLSIGEADLIIKSWAGSGED